MQPQYSARVTVSVCALALLLARLYFSAIRSFVYTQCASELLIAEVAFFRFCWGVLTAQ